MDSRHAPVSATPRAAPLAVAPAVVAVCMAALPSSLVAQIAASGTDTTIVEADPGDAVGAARAAQALFERRRVHFLPLTMSSFGGSCDEVVGRLCTTYGEGEWYPVPEDPKIVEMRFQFIATLDSLQTMAPRSEWILGQRVWYRFEAGNLDGALATARACGGTVRWWCRALEGFALHASGRYRESETAFEAALAEMDPESRRRWVVPRWPVDSDTRKALEDVEDDPGAESRLLDALWALADPLYLVEGNDRRTEHYARWTVAAMRERARNPFRLSWGPDLDQLTVCHGWEMGWERAPTHDLSSIDQVVGHKHPEGRDFMPPGGVLRHAQDATAEDLRADRRRPRSLYAPPYAPVLLPMDAQVALFPRGRRTVVVATHFLPADTTFHAQHHHPLPWIESGATDDRPDRIGLFALPLDSGLARAGEPRPPYAVERAGSTDGTTMLVVPTADYVISAETWSPHRRRAGRLRLGAPARPAPDDIATLSDVLFLAPTTEPPRTLEAALDLALPSTRVRRDQPIAIGWEVAGLGFRPETLVFELSVERTDRSLLNRIGGFLRLTDRPRPLSLSWEEPAPPEPGPDFHYLALGFGSLEPGRYEVRLVLHTAGRSDAATVGRFEVVE